MPKTSEMITSKFLKKEDVGTGALLTIKAVKQYDVAQQGAGPEFKWCCEFQEEEKPLVLNVTNTRLLEAILGSDDTDDWIGQKIVLYNDPSIMYAGKMTGGIRVRAPRNQQPPQPMDGVPF